MEQSGKVSADNGPIEEGGGGIGLLIANRFLLFLQPVVARVGRRPGPAAFRYMTHTLAVALPDRSPAQTQAFSTEVSAAQPSSSHCRPHNHPKISPPEDKKGRRCSWTQIKGIEQRNSFDLLSVRQLKRQTKIDAKKQSPKKSSEVQNLILTAVLGCWHTNILILDIS